MKRLGLRYHHYYDNEYLVENLVPLEAVTGALGLGAFQPVARSLLYMTVDFELAVPPSTKGARYARQLQLCKERKQEWEVARKIEQKRKARLGLPEDEPLKSKKRCQRFNTSINGAGSGVSV